MTTVLEENNSFLEAFEEADGQGAAWLNELRQRGIKTFRELGFPTTQMEEWRDTKVSVLEQTRFMTLMPCRKTDAAAPDLVKKYTFGKTAAAELVFVNGHFEPHLSTTGGLPRGVNVLSLRQTIENEPALVQAHLGKHANIGLHPFAALNTGFIRDGAVVHLGKSAVCEKPIHLLFLTIPGADPTACHPRVLVIAEENSDSSIVETYAGGDAGGGGMYYTNAVTEIFAAKNAKIDHNKLQQEGAKAWHTALMQVVLEESAAFVSHSTSIGSKLTRNDLIVLLNGEHAEATLNGLVLASGEQHIDNHTLLHHEKANCPSHELYKHVLGDKASAVFKGKIFVQNDAQKTDAKQTTKALLLTNEATMNSQPALEIYADDVKCTHGSTIGPVDENAVFYLISRGLSLAQARHLMTYAFAADITRRIKVTPVRTRIEDFMTAQHNLPQDLRITDQARHDVALQ